MTDSLGSDLYVTVSFIMPFDQRMLFSANESHLQEEDFTRFIPFNPHGIPVQYYYCHLTGDETESQIT